MNVFLKQRRRIRTRSVLLASYRRGHRAWEHWLEWEFAKAAVPVVLLTILHTTGWIAIPLAIFLLMLLAYAGWMIFVTWNGLGAFRKMDKRRLALLKASGVECNLISAMTSRRAWAAVHEGKTMREFLDGPPVG